MEKKVVIIGIIITLILLVVSVYISTRPKPYSPEEPETWVEDQTISVERATDGKGYMNEIGQQYRDEEISTVFELEGYYKGNKFFNQAIEDDEVKMKLTNEMVPRNGVIEGFMTETRKQGKWVVDIFVDEDWKNQLEFTNIYWGFGFDKERPMVFTEISPGIYHDSIIDDENRFEDNARMRMSGIIVGDITKEDTANKTIMVLI